MTFQDRLKEVKGETLQEKAPSLHAIFPEISSAKEAMDWTMVFLPDIVSNMGDPKDMMALFSLVPHIRSLHDRYGRGTAGSAEKQDDEVSLYTLIAMLKAMIVAPGLGHLSMEQLMEIRDEVSGLFVATGASSRLHGRYLQGLRSYYLELGLLKEAADINEQYEQEGKSHENGHCAGCYSFLELDIDYYDTIDHRVEALKAARKALQLTPKGWCSISVYRNGYLTHPEIYVLGKHQQDEERNSRIEKILSHSAAKDKDLIPMHFLWSSVSKGKAMLEQHIYGYWKNRNILPVRAVQFFLYAAIFLGRMNHDEEISLPRDFPGFHEAGRYDRDVLRNKCLDLASQAASHLDARNGNDFYAMQIKATLKAYEHIAQA